MTRSPLRAIGLSPCGRTLDLGLRFFCVGCMAKADIAVSSD